jgi:hypothetical protein
MTDIKNGSLLQRARYAALKMVRDAVVAGTGVSASATIAYVMGESVPPEYAALIAGASLAVWRIIRQGVITFTQKADGVSDGPGA